jgi:hypothetical protein
MEPKIFKVPPNTIAVASVRYPRGDKCTSKKGGGCAKRVLAGSGMGEKEAFDIEAFHRQ